jgi:hypothetical protein
MKLYTKTAVKPFLLELLTSFHSNLHTTEVTTP